MPCPHPCPCPALSLPPSLRSPAVVWNRGAPPNPRTAFQSEVPVRVRVEPLNSMNNRFRPDPGMKFRWAHVHVHVRIRAVWCGWLVGSSHAGSH